MTSSFAACRPFGLTISPWTADQIALYILGDPRSQESGPGVVVTPNIQHIDLMRADREVRKACEAGEIVICDGFPVYYYAKLRGCAVPGRVSGCDVVSALFAHPERLATQRLFFVVDRKETEEAVEAWARLHGATAACVIPPFGFERDTAYCRQLAEMIRAHGTTVLFLCVGAPRSEVFAHRQRDHLPPCWVLCVGQAVKIELGLVRRPPSFMQRLNLEWLWRLVLEPRRLIKRYPRAAIGFVLCVIADLRGKWAR